ncbi:hypothetical protein ICM05_05445 [Leucobacter sp. cx-42]|uniref:thiopeptide-type bacteriocin biosynthesis protein n=1 Tax=unclassified Leucobacter TaxID=2621730 RepID=UPI00165D7C3E|nr:MULTISPECIES: thiopeptide-type bacteriocin biosynthesis protein [unclassified Leucobacter]MBC9954090.1 hypothetical protein [Leucobacter sp. cx-42]
MSWLFLKIYPASPSELSSLLGVLGPLVLAHIRNPNLQITRWFFLRYADFDGVHLRFRFSSSDLRSLDNLYRLLKSDCARLGASAQSDVYEREVSKWSSTYIDSAEKAFQSTSMAVLQLLSMPKAESLRQKQLMLRAYFEATKFAWSPTNEIWQGFCQTHQEWWGARNPLPVVGKTPAFFSQQAATSWIPHAVMLSQLEDVLPRPPSYYFHHHLHLIANRLGLIPIEEAAVAFSARHRTPKEGAK